MEVKTSRCVNLLPIGSSLTRRYGYPASSVRHALLYLDVALESPPPQDIYRPLNEIELLQRLGEPSHSVADLQRQRHGYIRPGE